MCNLYSVTKGQQAIRELTRAMRDMTGNLPSLPGIFPAGRAPVVFQAVDGARELGMMRWGMPRPPQFGGATITNIRNTSSPHWRRWLRPANRCLVPVTSFCEYEDTKPRKTPVWFVLDDSWPPFMSIRIWTPWFGRRGTKAEQVDGEHKLFGFWTTEPNAIVAPIHPKAMPVILTEPEDMEAWMQSPRNQVNKLQRTLPEGILQI